jgi:hypothetical protein
MPDPFAEADSLRHGAGTGGRSEPQQQSPGKTQGWFLSGMGLSVAALVSLCVLSVAPAAEMLLGTPDKDRMLDAMSNAQKAARKEGPPNHLHFHPNTASPLPLMERLKRHYSVPGERSLREGCLPVAWAAQIGCGSDPRTADRCASLIAARPRPPPPTDILRAARRRVDFRLRDAAPNPADVYRRWIAHT